MLAGSAVVLAGRTVWAADAGTKYVGAARVSADGFQLCGLSGAGEITFRIPLPTRGHAAAAHPKLAEAVAFARRPGLYGLVIDCAAGSVLQRLSTPAGRHFYGHGAFTTDGSVLLTAENNIETGEGRIGLWAVDEGYRRIGEVASGGIGPHEIIRLPGGGFAVANGGIKTHPATGRQKLNLDTMRPNLAYLDQGLEITDVIEIDQDLRQNSIRHLAVSGCGKVAIAMQWQGDLFEAPPLLALHHPGRSLTYCTAGLGLQRKMNGYAGSVAFGAADDLVGITSPRGNAIQMFSAEGTFLKQMSASDVCGLAASDSGLIATSGTGKLLAVSGRAMSEMAVMNVAWDNHLVPVS